MRLGTVSWLVFLDGGGRAMNCWICASRSGSMSVGDVSRGGEGDVASDDIYIAFETMAPVGAEEGYESIACEAAKLRCEVQLIC